MAYCTNCGAQVDDNAKFCGVCGNKMPIKQQPQKTNTRKTVYDGTIHKCPNCGAGLSSFVKNCPECGYELRGTDVVESVSAFARRYAVTTSNAEKVDLIRTFVIPNTKEDILEFAILASSNIDEGSFTRDNVVVSGGATQSEVSEAWMAKFEQAYHKAAILLEGTSEFQRIERLYNQKHLQLQSAKKASSRRSFWTRNQSWLGIVGGIVLLLVLAVGIPLMAWGSGERKLEKQVKQIEAYIAEGNYDAALTTAYAMDDNYSDSWSETRANLIQRIKDLQGQSENHDGKVQIPTTNFKGSQYSDAIASFTSAGFTNVKAEPYSYDAMVGWVDKLMNAEGEVEEISINGETSYKKGGWVIPDTPVIIRYHHK